LAAGSTLLHPNAPDERYLKAALRKWVEDFRADTQDWAAAFEGMVLFPARRDAQA
jgi:hypothetical protein